MSSDKNSASISFSIGSIIAAILSWQTWHSLGWCVIHFLLGWIYVIYWLFNYWE